MRGAPAPSPERGAGSVIRIIGGAGRYRAGSGVIGVVNGSGGDGGSGRGSGSRAHGHAANRGGRN